MMERFRAAFKVAALVVVTAAAALPPLVLWAVTLGAPGPAGRLGVRCCRWWSRVSLRITGVKLDVEGRPEGRSFLVAANHLSYLDIWVLGSLYPTAFVAKHEIASWPLFGTIARAAGTLFIHRESPRDLVRTSLAMSEHLGRGMTLTLFPEGKATPGETVLPFMPSLFDCAAKAGVPCYSASISYETPDSPEPPSDTVCWWGGQALLPHVFHLLRLRTIRARLRFSEQALRSVDRKELARDLHAEVLRRFVPVRQERYSGATSQISLPKKPAGNRPSSQSSAVENCTSVK